MTALLFDFDGLLCDTERAAHESWVRTFARFGLPFPDDVWRRMHGHRGGEAIAVAELAARTGRPVPPEVVAERRALKGSLALLEPLRPGAADLLDLAHHKGFLVAVVSSSDSSWVDSHLRRLGVRALVAEVVTGAGLPPKPAPDLYLRALERLGRPAGEAIAFEDSAAGVAAAVGAGVRCVGVPSSVGRASDVAGAWLVLDSLSDFTLPPGRSCADRAAAIAPAARPGTGGRTDVGSRADLGTRAQVGSRRELGPRADVESRVDVGNRAGVGRGVDFGSRADVGGTAERCGAMKSSLDVERGRAADRGREAESRLRTAAPDAEVGRGAEVGGWVTGS